MGFFKSFTKQPEEDNITSLDFPDIKNAFVSSNIPQSPNFSKRSTQFIMNPEKIMVTQTFEHDMNDLVSPTNSEFSIRSGDGSYTKLMTSSGLKGEQERNLILEQQVKILSQQAALALDKWNEVTKENESLRKENEELSRSRSSDLLAKEHRHQGSISSNGSSVFSRRQNSTLSQSSSNNSIYSMNKSFSKQLESHDPLQREYEDKIESMNHEIKSLQRKIQFNEIKMNEFETQISSLRKLLETEKKENSTLLTKLFRYKESKTIELDYYKKQVLELIKQLEEKRENDIRLRQRLQDQQKSFTQVRAHRSTSRLC